MKNIRRLMTMIVVAIAFLMMATLTTGCFRQDYLMFEDGDFDGVEFSDYDLIQNAELDMDDADRD